MKPRIDLHIEELVLHGFAAGDRYRIGAAVEAELTRLFTEQGVPESMMRGIELPNLSLGSFQVKPGARPSTIGAQVAQAVYKGFSMGVQRGYRFAPRGASTERIAAQHMSVQSKEGSNR